MYACNLIIFFCLPWRFHPTHGFISLPFPCFHLVLLDIDEVDRPYFQSRKKWGLRLTSSTLSLMGTVIRLPCHYQFRLKPWCWESVPWAQKCVSSSSWRPHPSCEPLDATLKPWIHNYYSSPHCEVFHAKKNRNEMEMGPLGMRDVKDRDAKLRMEWDSDYTIAVAE